MPNPDEWMVTLGDFVKPPEPDPALEEIHAIHRLISKSIRVPAYVIFGLTEGEWILKRLIMTDEEIQDELNRRSSVSYHATRSRHDAQRATGGLH